MTHESKLKGIAFKAGRWPLDEGLPTLIFIHGAAGSSVLWERQVMDLADVANTIAIDLPGHGRSGGEASDSVEAYGEAVRGFIHALRPPRPVPCGLSLGGAVVLYLLLDDEENFAAAVLANTGARLRVNPLIFQTIETDYQAFVEGVRSMAASPTTDPSRLEPLIRAMRAAPPDVALADFRACDAFDVMGRLGRIKIPVLVLAASDDRLTPPKYGEYLAQNVSNARLKVIQRAGHLSPLERPEEVTEAIREFTYSI